jgi:hypothetical protein
MKTTTYECSKTGMVEVSPDGNLPHGWLEVKITSRVHNPEWVRIRQLVEAQIAGFSQQIPESDPNRELRLEAIEYQVRAGFQAAIDKVPEFIEAVEMLHLVAPHKSPDVRDVIGTIYEAVDATPPPWLDADGEDEEP